MARLLRAAAAPHTPLTHLRGALLSRGKYAEAEPPIPSGYEGLKSREATIVSQGKRRRRDGRRRLQIMKIGHRNGLNAEVLDGLTDRDQVVMHPSDQVADTVRIVRR